MTAAIVLGVFAVGALLGGLLVAIWLTDTAGVHL